MNEKERAAAEYFLYQMIHREAAEDAQLFAEAYAALMQGYANRVTAENVEREARRT